MVFSAANILEVLDEGAYNYEFPMLDNIYHYLSGTKIAAFRSINEWLIVFQKTSFFISAGEFSNVINAFGNNIKKNGIISIEKIISESLKDKMFDDEGNFLLNPLHFKVNIKGIEREFNPTEDDYKKIGIESNDDKMPNEAKIIRYLMSVIPNELFFSTVDLLKICGRENSNLEVFITLDDWSHPDLVNDEKPSEIPSFQSLAEALEKNDKALYKCLEEEYNTHWSNWEWYRED
jgi:hypothetical protein